MSQCGIQYFPIGESSQLSFSSSILTFVAHGGAQFMNTNERPFIPIIPVHGVVVGGQTVYSPLAVASGIAFPDLMLKLAIECRKASINKANGVIGGSSITNSENPGYEQYLYRVTNDNLPTGLNRFLDLYDKTYQFWLNANPAWTATQYYEALQNYIRTLITQADKSLFCAPGFYDFDAASPFIVAFNALKALDANFNAIQCLELYI